MEQTASPSFLADLHEQHKQRQARIKSRAIPEPIITITAPPQEPVAPFPMKLVEGKALELGLEALRSKPSLDIILDEVIEYYKVRKDDMLSARRVNYLPERRHVCIYMMYLLTDFSLPRIALKVRRDHSTAIYALKKVQGNLDKHRMDIEALEARIRPLLSRIK